MSVRITCLDWADDPLGEVDFPKRRLLLRHGIGSGLARDPHDPELVWALADRGPNVELHTAIDDYGWDAPAACSGQPDAKVMPRLDLGPYLARLRLRGDSIGIEQLVRLTGADGNPVPGCPPPDRGHAKCEPAYALDGSPIETTPAGMDTEGIAALADGSFWLGEEYGPSLVEVSADGTVRRRLVPRGSPLAGAAGVEERLPAIAAKRHLNRGFEAVTAAPSGERLFLAFQSPLAHPDRPAFEAARHVRLWELDRRGNVLAQYAYPLDPPDSFRRDRARKRLGWKDLKLCELAAVGERRLLALERILESCKIYLVELDPTRALPSEHLDSSTRPSLEELSARGDFPFPALDKRLLFSSDDHPEVSADMEGMTPLSQRSLLIVSDNDFGVLDKETRFFRLDFADPFAS